MTNNTQKKKNETLKLGIILGVCVILLIAIVILLFKTLQASPTGDPTEYIEIPVYEQMTLADAKSVLDSAQIRYEIVPTESKTPNKIEKIEYIGKEENGKMFAEIGTTVKLHSNEVSSDKIIYLTFDDGPIVNYTDNTLETIYHNTGEILDILERYNIKATFFLAGNQMTKPDRSQYVVEIYEEGHLIACHSFSHKYEFIYASPSNFVSDVKRFENELKSILGEEKYNTVGKYIRFPGGTIKNGLISKNEATAYLSAIREMGYKIYDWTFLTGDAQGNDTPEEMMSYMQETLQDAKNKNYPLILLLHDKNSTKNFLPEMLDYLISEGYYFDTIDNCPEYTDVEK